MGEQQAHSSVRSAKRCAGQKASESPAKKRAPYAPKACDACRRRKGRCDGRRPCEFCLSRSSECSYSDVADERMVLPANNDNTQALDETIWNPDTLSSTVKSLGELVANLQGRLNHLAGSTVQGGPVSNQEQSTGRQHEAQQPAAADDCASAIHVAADDHIDAVATPPTAPGKSPTQSNSTTRGSCTGQGFCGPTSPDYSLNVAQMKMGQGKFSDTGFDVQMSPGLDGSPPSKGHSHLMNPVEHSWATPDRATRQSLRKDLFRFRTLLSKRESLRLIRVYQGAVGELHPIVDCERLIEQTEGWYIWPTDGLPDPDTGVDDFPSGEHGLVILNLVLSIALCAETGSQSEHAMTLYKSCHGIISHSMAVPAAGIQHVILMLLVGIIHFFNDRPRLAWRMCGLAGRMAMEIGLHSRDVYQQFLETEKQQEEADTISTSLIVLDRQWSAATGLPPNFQLSDFDYANAASVRNMYLKAMMTFTVMSQRFNEPICRVATGGTYEDDDAFETTNFQIEQWRKRSLEKQKFSHPGTWQAGPPANMPLWTVILYLRANAVRCILLRPFLLFSSNSTESGRRSIEPGLDTISDTINILSILDRSTDVYRKQHPFLQHFLASASATLALIIAFLGQNRDAVSEEIRDTVGRNFRKALALASAYSDSSHASRKLYERLILIREPLARLGAHSYEATCPASGTKVGKSAANHHAPPVVGQSRHVRPLRDGDLELPHFGAPTPVFDNQNVISITAHPVSDSAEDGSGGSSDAPTYVNMSTGLYESFLDDWTTSDMNFFFSDSGM